MLYWFKWRMKFYLKRPRAKSTHESSVFHSRPPGDSIYCPVLQSHVLTDGIHLYKLVLPAYFTYSPNTLSEPVFPHSGK